MDINNILKGVDYFVIQCLAQVKDVRKRVRERLRMGYVLGYIIFGLVMGSKSKLKLEEAWLREGVMKDIKKRIGWGGKKYITDQGIENILRRVDNDELRGVLSGVVNFVGMEEMVVGIVDGSHMGGVGVSVFEGRRL